MYLALVTSAALTAASTTHQRYYTKLMRCCSGGDNDKHRCIHLHESAAEGIIACNNLLLATLAAFTEARGLNIVCRNIETSQVSDSSIRWKHGTFKFSLRVQIMERKYLGLKLWNLKIFQVKIMEQ